MKHLSALFAIVISITLIDLTGSNFCGYAAITPEFTYCGLKFCVQSKENHRVALIGYSAKPSGNLNIPGIVVYNYETYNVTSISNDAFRYCDGLTSVTIPNTVIAIGSHAFFACKNLTSVDIPNSVTTISDFAFCNCSGLTSINMSNSVEIIGSHAFAQCNNLTSVDIPSSVSYIGTTAFAGRNVKVHITDLEAWCNIDFQGYAFGFVNDLYLNGDLVRNLVIPESVKEIKNYSFYGFDCITSVVIPNSVTKIGDGAFGGCEGLTSIDIPNSVKSIGRYAFYCSSLTSIHIPSSVVSIGGGAFMATRLEEVYITDIAAWCNIDFEDANANYACHSKKLFLNDVLMRDLVIPESVSEIKNFSFNGFNYITSVVIPNSVTKIGDSAFGGCAGLTSIDIPNSVKSIGSFAFDACTALRSLTIGSNVEEFGYQLNYLGEYWTRQWARCVNLTDITYLATNPIDGTNTPLDQMFDQETYQNATLHYLESAKDKIESCIPWKLFVKKVAGIEDVEYNADSRVSVYDVNGIKVYEGTEEGMSLPTGIYIIVKNGKSVKYRV